MGVSQQFKIAVKLGDRPAWKIARDADIHPCTLSQILSGYIKVQPDDLRVLKVAEIVGVPPGKCFDEQG